jgi:hypothetical protein
MQEIINNIFKTYNKNEKVAVKDFSNYILKTFVPSTFLKTNMNTHLDSPDDLWKFFDTMQEFRVNTYFQRDLDGYLTQEEMKAIENIAVDYGNYTKFFNKKTIPIGISQIISSISTLRSILAKQEELKKNLSIFEIGAGSGMLGLLAKYFGINYTTFDITNAFAIHQSCLYETLFKKDFNNLGSVENKNYIDAQKLLDSKASITLLPWWHFLNMDITLPKYDIVIMNHCFYEIEKKALLFIFTRLGSYTQRQLTICSYWGSNKLNNYSQKCLISIERQFNIRREIIFSFNSIYIPKTIVAFSFKLKQKPVDFNFLKENIDRRLGFENNETQNSTSFFERLPHQLEKKLPKPIYIAITFIFITARSFLTKILNIKKHSLILGHATRTNYNIVEYNYPVIKILFNEFLLRIKKIEKLNNKPSFTDDELFGNYIKSKIH